MALFKTFKKYPNLKAILSSKKDGSMKLLDENELRRRDFLLNNKVENLVSADLVHGNKVRVVQKNDKGKVVPNTDGLITDQKGLFLSVTVADCLPLFIFDPDKQIVGMIHAGWKSLEKDIVIQTIEKFKSLGSNPKDLIVGIGPGISKCHFEVGKEVIEKFKKYPEAIDGEYLDLKLIAKLQFEKLGVRNIEINPECTYCSNKYFSYRRDKSKTIKAMIAIIGIV